MSQQHISATEFDRWMNHLDKRFDRVEQRMEEEATTREELSERIVTLETNQLAAGKLSTKLSAAVSLIVSALAAGVLALLGSK